MGDSKMDVDEENTLTKVLALEPSSIDDVICDSPKLDISNQIFLLSCSKDPKDVSSKIMEGIQKYEMAPLYSRICEEGKFSLDKKLFQNLQKANADECLAISINYLTRLNPDREIEEHEATQHEHRKITLKAESTTFTQIIVQLKQLDDKIEDSTENMGESEVRLSTLARANFLCRIGEKEKAIEAFDNTLKKTVGVGRKMEIVFTQIRIGMFFRDNDMIQAGLDEVMKLCEQKDSDWERRNRMLVYKGLHHITTRQFEKAAECLLKTLETFSASEILDFTNYVRYTVLMSVISLDRKDLKSKVVDSPEVLGVIEELPTCNDVLNGLYRCNYKLLFEALAKLTEELKCDQYMHQHAGFFCREMRVKAYAQFLSSYRSVTMDAMSQTFGVTTDYIDMDISRFVAAGRVCCKIDKVAGIIETNRPDAKSGWYMDTVKQGDVVLNRIEKLARVIS